MGLHIDNKARVFSGFIHLGRAQNVDDKAAFYLLDFLVQAGLIIIGTDYDRFLGDNRSGIDAGIDKVDRSACDLYPVVQGIAHAVGPGKRRQQRRVGIDGPTLKTRKELRAKDLHKACGNHDVGLCGGNHCGQVLVPQGAVTTNRNDLGGDSGLAGLIDAQTRNISDNFNHAVALTLVREDIS